MNEKIYLDKRVKKADGNYPIKLYVKHIGKFLISLNMSANDIEFSDGAFTKANKNYKANNLILRGILAKAENEYVRLREAGLLPKSDKEYKKHLEYVLQGKKEEKEEPQEILFVDMLNKFVSLKTNKGTKTLYNTTKNKVLEFDPNCTLESINRVWLSRFESSLSETLKINAYAIHLRNIRAVFNFAIDEEYTKNYPFRKFKIKKEETRKRALTIEQLRDLKNRETEDYQKIYVDMFFLDFYLIGMNIGNLLLMQKDNLINGRLIYHRNKTNKLISVKVEKEAQEIIDRYKGNGKYLLNIMDRYKNYHYFLKRMNLALKNIGSCKRIGLGGKKYIKSAYPDLSTYWARHTWATLAAEIDIPKETIAHALSHSINDVTSIYIKFDDKKVDEANRRVIDWVLYGKKD